MTRDEYKNLHIETTANDPANPTQAEQAAAEAAADAWERSKAVDAWLANLRDTDPDRFDQVRKLYFEEQATLAGV